MTVEEMIEKLKGCPNPKAVAETYSNFDFSWNEPEIIVDDVDHVSIL